MKYPILMQLFLMLLANKRVTVSEIMTRFDLPRRTVFRYIDTLCVAGIPITSYYGRNGGFSIEPNFKMGATFFDREEQEVLTSVLSEHIKANPQDLTAAKINDKLNALFK